MESSTHYAMALFNLAFEKDKLDKYHDELISLKEVIKENEKFLELLDCQFIAPEERKSLLDNTFKDYEEDIRNFLKVLLDKHRLRSLYEIIDLFLKMYQDNKGIIRGKVYSTYPLSKEQIKRIEKAFLEKKKQKIILENEIDENLIGGIRLILKDKIYDASLKNKLEQMKSSLKKEGEA